MGELNNLIMNAVKQLCRRAAYELEFDLKEDTSKSDIVNGRGQFSNLYSDPHEHLAKFIHAEDEAELEENISELISLNGFNRSELKFLHFLNNLKSMQPEIENKWIWLRHYMHYIYREFVVSDPKPTFEEVSPALLQEMRQVVLELINNDECQLLAKMVALLREYCLCANNIYTINCKQDKTTVSRLFHYYEAILEAAKNVKSVFPEFDKLFQKNYSFGWIDLNTTIFIYFFFDVSYLQENIYEFFKSTETSTMKSLLLDLSKLWCKEQYRISSINEAIYHDTSTEEMESLLETKRLMKYSFWMIRTTDAKTSFSKEWLDHQIMNIITGKSFEYTGGILDKNGNCLCENCAISKCKAFMETKQLLDPNEKYLACNKCQLLTLIEQFSQHLLDCKKKNMSNEEFFEEAERQEANTDTTQPTPKKRIHSTENSNNVSINNKELLKVVSTCEKNFSSNSCGTKSPINKSSLLKSEVTRNKNVAASDEESTSKKSVITIKKDLYNFKESYDKGFIQAKEDFRKYAEKVICDHHHKEKKCDCSHCDVDNSHSHKSTVLRNRLRSRLNQRRDKRTKGLTFTKTSTSTAATGATTAANATATSITKSTTLKEEERTICTNISRSASTSTSKSKSTMPLPLPLLEKHDDSSINDIHGLLNYIEGNKNVDKATLAKKKAEKKARQRQKKEDERLEAERKERETKEAEMRERESQRKIEQDLARQLQEKLKITSSKSSNDSNKNLKKKKKDKDNKQKQENTAENTVLEETIPAMVTIKRLVNNDNTPPTVTITLKGSSPDQDKLLYTLVNGSDKTKVNNENNCSKNSNNNNNNNTTTINNTTSTSATNNINSTNNYSGKKKEDTTKNNKKNNKGKNSDKNTQIQSNSNSNIIAKELKVTIALDSSSSQTQYCDKKNKMKKSSSMMKIDHHACDQSLTMANAAKCSSKMMEIEMQKQQNQSTSGLSDLPMLPLRLPPGITITKVDGSSLSNRNNYKVVDSMNTAAESSSSSESTIKVNQSGVIVVDTEKLIQQTAEKGTSKKKSKRKKKKSIEENCSSSNSSNNNIINRETTNKGGEQMITLKNPIFQTFQPSKPSSYEDSSDNHCAPAAIFTNENGMVTIRSSRLQQSLNAGGGSSVGASGLNTNKLLSDDLKPILSHDISTSQQTMSASHSFNNHHFFNNDNDNKPMSAINAQEILSGLPGIEITKVDKKTNKKAEDVNKVCQTAQVSIIATKNNDHFNMEKMDDWTYDVFTPKDILEDDMDADELELEAFKRFCQQSVPPKRKEKVAHLNVKDIILKKKNDANI